jgi:ArsR family transcriptional regulator, arsenate/arsenite/antimonite-responsive transcriptional repressor
MLKTLNIMKALSDENRIRALMMLTGGELCVCQIIEMLRIAPSTVSKHISILRQAGLVESRKEGRWVYYQLARGENQTIREILEWLKEHLKNDNIILDDVKQLRRMRKMSKEQICKCYRS